jgi:hypothetical protein
VGRGFGVGHTGLRRVLVDVQMMKLSCHPLPPDRRIEEGWKLNMLLRDDVLETSLECVPRSVSLELTLLWP